MMEALYAVMDMLLQENPKSRIGVLSNGAETLLYE